MIYFDNGATSWPKPESVYTTMDNYLRTTCANPGKSGHSMSLTSARYIYETRETIARFLGVPDSAKIIFFNNATSAINQALKGLLKPSDHVIVSSLEHNALMRPLIFLKETIGITISILPTGTDGTIDMTELNNLITDKTKLVALVHASNVTGALLPIKKAGNICRQRGVISLVDAAQSAGAVNINMIQDEIDLLAFTGHKALYGPQGSGALCINGDIPLVPLIHGGTGSNSESDYQPDHYPDLLESGTLNSVGIVGLNEGIKFIEHIGLERIVSHETTLISHLLQGLSEIEEIVIYGPTTAENRTATLAFNIKGLMPSHVAYELDKNYGIMCRPGLHCAPMAHKTIGTFPTGTVRFSLGYFNTEEEIDIAVKALKEIVNNK